MRSCTCQQNNTFKACPQETIAAGAFLAYECRSSRHLSPVYPTFTSNCKVVGAHCTQVLMHIFPVEQSALPSYPYKHRDQELPQVLVNTSESNSLLIEDSHVVLLVESL